MVRARRLDDENDDYRREQDAAPAIGPIEPIVRLNADLREAARTLQQREVRYLVSLYYEMQEQRIRAKAQVRTGDEQGEPNKLVDWMLDNYRKLENDIKRAMDSYTDGKREGRWMKSIVGIGPVLSAGLLAHINLERAAAPAAIWRLAGLDPGQVWMSADAARKIVSEHVENGTVITRDVVYYVAGILDRNPEGLWAACMMLYRGKEPEDEVITRQKLSSALALRPWNDKLKVLCWKIGQSFVYTCNHKSSHYGPLYQLRKGYETAKNLKGDYATQAARILEEKDIGEDTIARKSYEKGQLPLGHIQARAERWTAKLFLSHMWAVMYECHYGRAAPDPYALAHLGHTDMHKIPNWPID